MKTTASQKTHLKTNTTGDRSLGSRQRAGVLEQAEHCLRLVERS
jgi:hypothetical protein